MVALRFEDSKRQARLLRDVLGLLRDVTTKPFPALSSLGETPEALPGDSADEMARELERNRRLAAPSADRAVALQRRYDDGRRIMREMAEAHVHEEVAQLAARLPAAIVDEEKRADRDVTLLVVGRRILGEYIRLRRRVATETEADAAAREQITSGHFCDVQSGQGWPPSPRTPAEVDRPSLQARAARAEGAGPLDAPSWSFDLAIAVSRVFASPEGEAVGRQIDECRATAPTDQTAAPEPSATAIASKQIGQLTSDEREFIDSVLCQILEDWKRVPGFPPLTLPSLLDALRKEQRVPWCSAWGLPAFVAALGGRKKEGKSYSSKFPRAKQKWDELHGV